MGGGGLIQLVSTGQQDARLTGAPQITFFKTVFRRYTNFSMESIQQNFTGATDTDTRVSCIISRNGDLLHRLWLEIDLPAQRRSDGVGYVQNVGHAILESVEVQIGGQRVDKRYGRYMSLMDAFTCKSEKKHGYRTMTGGNVDERNGSMALFSEQPVTLFVPVQVWFSSGPVGQALPLISLQYHEVRLILEIAPLDRFIRATDPIDGEVVGSASELSNNQRIQQGFLRLFGDYYFLDTEERKRFAAAPRDYLIEQLQFNGVESVPAGQKKINLTLEFNHPVKCLYWMASVPELLEMSADPHSTRVQPQGTIESRDIFSTLQFNPFESVGLHFNGNDRFQPRSGEYFRLVQAHQYHTRVPDVQFPGMYSFSLAPEEQQPSGSANMSRLDSVKLLLTLRQSVPYDTSTPPIQPSYDIYVYAVNYNVLKIMNGMGGLEYSS